MEWDVGGYNRHAHMLTFTPSHHRTYMHVDFNRQLPLCIAASPGNIRTTTTKRRPRSRQSVVTCRVMKMMHAMFHDSTAAVRLFSRPNPAQLKIDARRGNRTRRLSLKSRSTCARLDAPCPIAASVHFICCITPLE